MFEIKKNDDKIMLNGRLDTTSAPEFEKYCKKGINTGENIVFDFEELDYISSAGLRVLLTLKKKCNKDGGNIAIVNISDENKSIFEVTGFDQMFDIK